MSKYEDRRSSLCIYYPIFVRSFLLPLPLYLFLFVCFRVKRNFGRDIPCRSKRRWIISTCAWRHYRPLRRISANRTWNDTARIIGQNKANTSERFWFLVEDQGKIKRADFWFQVSWYFRLVKGKTCVPKEKRKWEYCLWCTGNGVPSEALFQFPHWLSVGTDSSRSLFYHPIFI